MSCGGGDALSTTCEATGLTGGTEYNFEVLATSAARESDRSAALTQSTSPAAVGAITFSDMKMESMVLTWSAPAGGAPTGYIVYRDDGDGATPSIVAYDGTGATATTATISDLTGGTAYSYVVESLSGAGVGDVSAVATQSTSPATPLDLSSTLQTSTSISLSWSASVVQTNGEAVTNYRVYQNDGAGGSLPSTATWESTDGTATSTAMTVDPGTLYAFAVSAVSAAGEGELSSELSQSSAPGAPAAPTSTHQTSTSISLSWTAPSSDSASGDDATRYRVYDSSSAVLYDGEQTAFEHDGLTGGTSYSYTVSALSGSGEGDASASAALYTSPGVATGLAASDQTTHSIKLDWTAPSVASETPVLGYKVYERVIHELSDVADAAGIPDSALQTMLSGSTDKVVVDSVVYDGRSDSTASTTLSGLSGGVEYAYVVATMSSAGEGDRSTALSASTSPPAPVSYTHLTLPTSDLV